ncbi:MAG TPA: division/cell wall cluster transcriptional repressor MraZ [Candidatus Binataceae bacterium]|nr:division/cell wall cluster transcriptional repressor MraZ [Candidatus Binataceae bacterium]
MFSGRFDHSIDDKGRVSIPVRFRENLERDSDDRLFITNFISQAERCLVLYPPGEWLKVVGRLRQRSGFEGPLQLFQTFFIGGAHEVQVDKQGRILIPPKLREFARLDRDVTFSAMTDHFQLWNKPTLERVLSAAEEQMMQPGFYEQLKL